MEPKFLSLYGELTELSVHDSSRGQEDTRLTCIAERPDGRKIAVKVTRNNFTTPERVLGWAALADQYNSIGIYVPRVLSNLHGALYACVDGFIVYAEEFSKYPPAQPDGAPDLTERPFEEALFTSIGRVAAHPAPLVPWQTAYCLYDRFCPSDPSDENLDCANSFLQCFRALEPRYAMHAVRSGCMTRICAFVRHWNRCTALFRRQSFRGILTTRTYCWTTLVTLRV